MHSASGSRPLRLCLVTHALRRHDGQGRVNYEVAKAALEEGHHLTILSMACAEELVIHPRVRWIQTGSETLPTQLVRNVHFANQSARWLRKHRGDFDLLQANGFVTWEPCDIIAVHFVHTAWLKSPFFPFRLLSLQPGSWYQWLYTVLNARWERRAFRGAKEIVAVSRKTAAEVERLGVTKKPVVVIYNGVDLTDFHPGPSSRAPFGLPEGVPMALFVGDIQTPRKNLPTVLRAMQQVPELHLAVAAAKEGSPYIQEAEQLGLASRVHFLGKTSQVADLMRAVDMMVFPSRYEAHPLVVLEAMACGLPTIVSSLIAKGESFADACVLLEDANNPAQLAQEIRVLLADPARRQMLSEMGHRAASELSWTETGQQYVNLYGAMTASAPATAHNANLA